ncbi:MAG TPA: copper oxidase, partial [Pedococcus sp.]|nr:copper oxidase [Pedococcus sp.]
MTRRRSRFPVPESRPALGGARGFWFLRDVPVVLWLVATVGVALMHTALPAPRWLLIHLLLLGAASHSILVWSRHFTDAMLHSPARTGDRGRQSARLALLNGGALIVVVGVLIGRWPVTSVGAAAIAGATLWHGGSLLVQLRAALPARFAMTVRYYIAAATLLPVGALLGTLMARGTTDRTQERLMLAHVSLNVLGWLGLTVLGTL